MTSRPGPELEALIGEAAFVRLAEAFGGTRLYVPVRMGPDHEIVQAIGAEAAALLAKRLAPDQIRVPLAREARARQYRAEGRSNAQIARALGINETTVNRLFQSMACVPEKGSGTLDLFKVADPDQYEMFK